MHLTIESNTVIDTIAKGQTLILNKEELGNFKYRGKCPTSIASLIKLYNTQGDA